VTKTVEKGTIQGASEVKSMKIGESGSRGLLTLRFLEALRQFPLVKGGGGAATPVAQPPSGCLMNSVKPHLNTSNLEGAIILPLCDNGAFGAAPLLRRNFSGHTALGWWNTAGQSRSGLLPD
jgi:hypothetical protein